MGTPDRLVPNSSTGGAVLGDPYMDAVQDEITGLWNFAEIPLTNVGGTADAITAQITPAFTGSITNGMKFGITPTAANTISGLTLRIDGPGGTPTGTAIGVVDRDGNAIAAGNWKASRRHVVEYDSGLTKYRVIENIEPTPVAAVPLPSFRNILMNGGMEIWQRGAGDSAAISVPVSTTAYTADRWYLATGANQACTVNRSTGVLSNRSRSSGTVLRNSGQTGTSALVFAYPLTTEECARMRGATISLQFLIDAATNFSPTSGTFTYNVYFGTGVEGKRGAGFTGETNPISGSSNLTPNVIVQITATSGSPVAANVTQGELRFTWTPVGTAGALDGLTFDDVQLEVSSAATAFEYLPFGYMLRECQQHYAKTFPYNTAPAQAAGVAGAAIAGHLDDSGAGGSYFFGTWRYPIRMRVSPSVISYNPVAATSKFRKRYSTTTMHDTDGADPSGATRINFISGVASELGCTFDNSAGLGSADTVGGGAPGYNVGLLHLTADAAL